MLRRKTFDFGRSLLLPERYVRDTRTDGRAPFAPDYSDRSEAPPPAPLKYRPSPGYYRVRLSPEREMTASGLYLPDTWVENRCEGQVLANGPEPRLPGNLGQATMWAVPGDLVLFRKHSLNLTDPEAREGLVHDRDLLAVAYPGEDDELRPLNDYCKILQDEPPWQATDAIAYAEEDRPRPMSGILKAFGPGKVRKAGPFAGTRRPCAHLWGMSIRAADNLLGKRVYWHRQCEALAIGRETLEFLLLKADDLVGWE